MTLHIAIQNAILAEIARPEFNAALPPLSETAWLRIIDPSPGTKNENERLEFLGDAMMYATLGRQLYEQLPDGSPGLYTVCVYLIPNTEDHCSHNARSRFVELYTPTLLFQGLRKNWTSSQSVTLFSSH